MIDFCYFLVKKFSFFCRLNIQELDIEDNFPVIILGSIFMKQYVTIFDEEKARIGIATAKFSNQPIKRFFS
jgi:hypothetical protein